jgi:hypothetical protein
VLQALWYQVNQGQEIYVIGTILDDLTVRGGTGWGAECAKLCNKPLCVFDQAKNAWFEWTRTPGNRVATPRYPSSRTIGNPPLASIPQGANRGVNFFAGQSGPTVETEGLTYPVVEP